MHPHRCRCDYQTDNRCQVLKKHPAQRWIGGVDHITNCTDIDGFAVFFALQISLHQRKTLEDKGDGQDNKADGIVGLALSGIPFGDTGVDRDDRACHKHAKSRNHRPNIGLFTIAERMASIGRFDRLFFGDYQQRPIASIRPRVRRLSNHRGRASHKGRDRLCNGDNQICPNSD